ncbi:MAG: cation diffusion facilitator family transporter [Bacteroidales bacterium]|nr:cation diffusion facilitator family transporter [Bacteroidales bacterium]
MNIKVKTARLSIFSNTLLILIKLIAGFLSGSVSILSEAIHSMMDLIAAVIAFFSVKISGRPPDREHPYDHGKFENISGVIEGMLILLAAGWIIYEAVLKLNHPEEIGFLYLGMIVMALSAGINFFVSKKLYKVAKETDSIALEADALHLQTDVYTSVGVTIGIFLIWLTGLHFLDPIVAILVALFIVYEAIKLIKNAYLPLLDTSLPDEEITEIESTLNNHMQSCMSYHQFRTRKSGPHKYVDFHMEVPENMSVKEAHDLCDSIEHDLKQKIRRLDINIHIEPCKNDKTKI